MATVGALGGELNIVARHGHTIGSFQVTAKNPSGAAMDLTGAVFSSVIKETWDGPPVEAFDIQCPVPSTGVFSYELPDNRCATLNEGGKYVYLISITMSSKKYPLLYGAMELRGA